MKPIKGNNSHLHDKMKGFIFGLLLCFCMSCTNPIDDKPEQLIGEDQMVEIWADMMLGSAAKSLNTKDHKNYKNLMPVILKKYNIDSIQLARSNRYYTMHIDRYEKIFERVESRLKELKRIYDPKAAELDSIQKHYDLEATEN